MRVLSIAGSMLLAVIPTNSRLVYRLCKRVIDRYSNDNNGDMETNGERHLIQSRLPKATVVFDVGANVGEWTEMAIRINPDAQYHCFEPNPTTYKSLVSMNFPNNVILNDFGLGESSRSMELYISDGDSGNDSLYMRSNNTSPAPRNVKVRIETLDDYCEEMEIPRINFLKLDVEGHELSVLRGGRKLLMNGKIDAIQFEYGGTYIDAGIRLKDVWEYMAEVNADYCFYKLYPKELRPVPAYHPAFESYQYSNWVLLKEVPGK